MEVVTTKIYSNKIHTKLLTSNFYTWIHRQWCETTDSSVVKKCINICSRVFLNIVVCKCTHMLNSEGSDASFYCINSICLLCD